MNKPAFLVGAAAATLLLLLSTTALHAQDGFFFGHPTAQLTVRAGPTLHRASGDLFDFFTTELTLDRGDFRAPSLAVELAVYVHPRLDVVAGMAYSQVEARSEFRHWVDNDDQPIEQRTRLRVVPVTVSGRFYPLERGRAISSLAWVPARTTPYVGGGGGMSWYHLQQVGDFIAFSSDDRGVFSDDYRSSSVAPTVHALVGVDHWFTRRLAVNVEGRYSVASTEPEDDFLDWDRIDLSGLQIGVGVSLRW